MIDANLISGEQDQWIRKQLGFSCAESITTQRVNNTPIGKVFHITADHYLYYFKTGTGFEAAKTDIIKNFAPGLLPKIVSADKDRNWLLSRHGGKKLICSENHDYWLNAVEALGTFHNSSKSILRSPFFERIAYHKSNFDYFFRNWGDPKWQKRYKIDDELLDLVNQSSTKIESICQLVESLSLQECVVHGDAHPMNCLINGTDAIWYDWREAHIDNPLVDIGWFLIWLMPYREFISISINQALLESLLNKYLTILGLNDCNLSIYEVAIFALIHRINYFGEQSLPMPYGQELVAHFARLLRRAINQKIGN